MTIDPDYTVDPTENDPTIVNAIGTGAYAIGGGSFDFGQSASQAAAQAAYAPPTLKGPIRGIFDAVDRLGDLLVSAPLSSLQSVQPYVPNSTADDFSTHSGAVAKIVDALDVIPGALGMQNFLNWLDQIFNKVSTWISQTMQILGGDVVTAFDSSVQAVKDFFNDLQTWQTNHAGWMIDLLTDVIVLLDVFHVVYQKGTMSDAPGTLGSNGKPTWYSCWNDLKITLGLAKAEDPPTDDAPTIGDAITAAQGDATTAATNAATAQTTANTNKTWLATKLNIDLILLDVLHLIYQKGSSSDTWGTLGTNGKPTWYSAWNAHLALVGALNAASPPTDTAPTTEDAITLNAATASAASAAASLSQATTQDLMNQGVGAQTGVVPVLATSADFYTAYQNIPESNVGGASGSTVAFGAVGAGGTGSANNNASATWSHTPASTDTALYVVVASSYPAPTGNNGTSVSAGGNNMTLVETQTTVAGFGACILLETWRIALTPSASPSAISIVAHVSAAGAIKLWGQSFSYFGQKVARVTFGSGTFASGSNSQSITIPALGTGHILLGVGMMYLATSSGSFTGPAVYFTTSGGTASGSSRWNNGGPTNQVYVAQAESSSTSTGKLVMGVTAPAGTSGSNWLAQAIELSN